MITTLLILNNKPRFYYQVEYDIKDSFDNDVGYYDWKMEVTPVSTKEFPLGFVKDKLARIYCQKLTPIDVC